MIPYLDLDAARLALWLRQENRISAGAFAVGLALASFIDGDTKRTTVDTGRLAARGNVHRRTVTRAIHELQAAGFLATDYRAGRSTVFVIQDGEPPAQCLDTPGTVSPPPRHSVATPPAQCRPIHSTFISSQKLPTSGVSESGQTPTAALSKKAIVSHPGSDGLPVTYPAVLEGDHGQATDLHGQGATVFDMQTPDPAKAKPKTTRKTGRAKLTPSEAEAAAKRILQEYKEIVPPSKDNSRGRAKQHLIKLLRDHTEADLIKAAQNMAAQTDPKYRRHAGNFFSTTARDFEPFLPSEFEPPDPMDGWTAEEIAEEKAALRCAIEAGMLAGMDCTVGIAEFRRNFGHDPKLNPDD